MAFVEPETKEKVMKAVSDLNYKPNLAARSLKKGGSKLIGLIIPDIMNPYYPEVVKYMEACATKAGYSLILCDALGDVKKEIAYYVQIEYKFFSLRELAIKHCCHLDKILHYSMLL